MEMRGGMAVRPKGFGSQIIRGFRPYVNERALQAEPVRSNPRYHDRTHKLARPHTRPSGQDAALSAILHVPAFSRGDRVPGRPETSVDRHPDSAPPHTVDRGADPGRRL